MKNWIPTFDEVRSTIRRWLNPTKLVAARLRDTLVGVLVTVGLAEVCVYRLLHHHVVAGDLSAYTAEALVVGYYTLEACLAPLVSWWGYRARRQVFITWVSVLTACLTVWFLLRTPGEQETGLCSTSIPEGSIFSVARLIILLASGPVLVSTRAAVWSHGLAYIEDHVPDPIPLYYSVFVLTRALPLLIGKGIVSLIDRNLPVQVALFVVSMVLSILQLMAVVPKKDPKVKGVVKSPPPMNDRGFCASVGRVVRNSLVTSHLLVMALLAAALWSYGYYRSDVIKVKFNMTLNTSNNISHLTEVLQYSFLIIVVAFIGVHLSPPLSARFSRTKAVKYALAAGLLALAMLLLTTIVSFCEPGSVVVDQTNCSMQCGCAGRYMEFSPVCMLDDLTTYPSPCHAGCSPQEVVDGLSVYVNCTCGSRAVAGACGADRCRAAYDLHQMLFVVIAALIISAMSTHGVVALRAADARDRAVAVGAGSAALALVFAATHTFLAMATSNMCSLFAGGVCVLPTADLPQLVGISSAVLVVLSCLISIFVWLRLRRSTKRSETDI